jgi:ribosomal protein L12E/L44/L45/RPP1/RPP2
MRGRRAARRTGRRTARRTSRRTVRRVRRRRRRRILVGGMVLLAVGGAAYGAIKLTQQDAERVEEHTGASVEELSEEELVAAMEDLGIKSIELTDDDKAIVASETDQTAQPAPASAAAAAPAEPEESYLDELERLANLRERGIITEEEFEAKKKQLLGV